MKKTQMDIKYKTHLIYKALSYPEQVKKKNPSKDKLGDSCSNVVVLNVLADVTSSNFNYSHLPTVR